MSALDRYWGRSQVRVLPEPFNERDRMINTGKGKDMPWYDRYDEDDDRGGNDEYYTSYCPGCGEVTEHDVCTDECVDC